MNSQVEYRRVEGWPGYRVGSDGSVWSQKSRSGKGVRQWPWRQLSPCKHSAGYLQVVLSNGDKRKLMLVHRLILEVFIGPPPDGSECCHGDGDRTNNRVSNLRWDSRQENIADIDRSGGRLKGETSPLAKLREADVRAIRASYGVEGGYKRIASMFDVTPATVYDIVKRRTWSHLET